MAKGGASNWRSDTGAQPNSCWRAPVRSTQRPFTAPWPRTNSRGRHLARLVCASPML